MTTIQKTSRAEHIRKRRSSQNHPKPASKAASRTSRQAYSPGSIFLPIEPRRVVSTNLRQTKSGTLRQAFGVSSPSKTRDNRVHRMAKDNTRKGYDFAFSLGHTAVRAPLLSLPNLGPRWISAGLTLLLGLMIYTLLTANTFNVATVEVTGNQRLAVEDVNGSLNLTGQSILNVIPSLIEKNLRTVFPDLAGVTVQVGFPNHVLVTVVERTPVLAWYQDGKTTWIDTNGIAFTPRGDVRGLIQVASSGTPPTPAADPQKSLNDQSFISPAMVQAILLLYPQVPGEAPMIYDPNYGVGWQDPRGWSVFFGQDTQAIDLKKKIYQTILDTFSKQGIQPTLISVANLDAPFYK
jgi:hypothetical protein